MDISTALTCFHRHYYDSLIWAGGTTSWLGWPVAKCPLDLWMYQEILVETRPQLIVESGTFLGGSALYLACLCDLLGHGSVLTIDIERREILARHPRIEYLVGSSVSAEVLTQVQARAAGRSTMVILDSDHHFEHVLAEMRLYSRWVTMGQYLIVEDGNINGHPVLPEFGPGPFEAVAEFVKENGQFAVDRTREKFLLSFNPNGYLRRISL